MANIRQPTGAANRARPVELIDACRTSLVKHLLAYVAPAFEETQETLFTSAEKAISTALQNRLLEAQRVLLKTKAVFTDAFAARLADGFNAMIDGESSGAKQPAPETPENDSYDEDKMSLVGEQDLEESLAISDMVSKAEVRFTQQIYALNQRLTVLNRGRPVKNDSNPCGPLNIGKAIRHAAICLELEAEIKVVLYHRFDRLLQKNLGLCYQEINDYLVAAGILPNIALTVARRPARPPPAPSPSAQNDSENSAPPVAQQLAPVAGPPQAGLAAATSARRPGAVDFFGRALQSTSTESQASGAPVAPEIVNSIREMMARQLGASDDAQPPPGSFIVAPQRLLGSAMSKLQMSVTGAEPTARISSAEIRRRLTEALGNDPETGKPILLSKRDAQTIDIIDLVYDHIQQEKVLHEPVKKLLHKMQVPMIRVAMQDPGFFEQANHPAREFFNTVADAGELWLEDDPENSPTFLNINTALDRVLEDYRGDNDVFKELLGDLNEHINVLSRKATLTERRHVDAAKGQEKLGMAREHARKLIASLIKKYQPPEFVESLLSQPWTDFLTLIALRHGDDSEQWKSALKVAKVLIYLVRDALDDNIKASLRKRIPWLRDELTKGLNQVGYFEQDIEVVLDKLKACYEWRMARGEREEKEKAREAAAEPDSTLPVAQAVEDIEKPQAANKDIKSKRPQRADLNEAERAMVAKLRLMAFGTWFELKLKGETEFVKRKLSWFSPLTGRCLFVNNQGSIAEEIYIEELAQSMVSGRARVFEARKKSLIDRAFSAIFGRLKKMTAKVAGASKAQT